MGSQPTILVTGAGGFIGRHLVAQLLDQGARLVCVVRDASRCALDAGTVHLVEGDLRHEATLAQLPPSIDAVVHLAAMLGEWGVDAAQIEQANVHITRGLLAWFSASPARQFVQVSTPGVQGFGHRAAAEDVAYNPRGAYEQSKVLAEQAVMRHAYNDAQGWTILRPDFVYGPGDRRRIKLYRRIQRRRWIKVGRGDAVLRPTYVGDVCEAIGHSLLDPRAYGQVFNVAGPEPVTAEQYVDGIATALGVPRPRLRLPAALFMAAAGVFEALARRSGSAPLFSRSQVEFLSQDHATDIAKIRRTLGFVPRTDLAEGMGATVAWAREEGLL